MEEKQNRKEQAREGWCKETVDMEKYNDGCNEAALARMQSEYKRKTAVVVVPNALIPIVILHWQMQWHCMQPQT